MNSFEIAELNSVFTVSFQCGKRMNPIFWSWSLFWSMVLYENRKTGLEIKMITLKILDRKIERFKKISKKSVVLRELVHRDLKFIT